jgi:hypothetical protein
MIPEGCCALPHFRRTGGKHSALTECASDLVLAKRKCGNVAKRAHRPSSVRCALSLRAILNNKEVSLPSELQDRIHLAWMSGEMNYNNRARLRS